MNIHMTVEADALHVRDAAKSEGKSLGFLIRGQEVAVTDIDKTGLWGKVSLNGTSGWCSLKYLLPKGSEAAPWLALACQEIGVKEIPGKGSHPRIVEYMATVDDLSTTEKDDDSGTSWCSCFVNWCVQKADVHGTNSAAAQSWRKWRNGKPADCVLPGSISAPKVGDIAVWERVAAGDWHGHVSFFIAYEESTKQIIALGGNQSDAVRYSRYPYEAANPYYKLLTLRCM